MCDHTRKIVDYGSGPSCGDCGKKLPRQFSPASKPPKKVEPRPLSTVKFV